MSAKPDQSEELYAMRHSLAHITANAVQHLWPSAKFGVGPVVEHGFYGDVVFVVVRSGEQRAIVVYL